jgi:hypothetical protein
MSKAGFPEHSNHQQLSVGDILLSVGNMEVMRGAGWKIPCLAAC